MIIGQGKEWLYFLLDSMGRSWRKENGLIVAKNDPVPLKFTPSGWQDISIAWARDLTLFGVNRNFTLPLGFVQDAYEIMKYIKANKNFEEKLYLLIQKQKLYIDPSVYYFWYDFFYRGQMDLTSSVDDYTAQQTTMSVKEGRITKSFTANQGTTYPLELYVGDAAAEAAAGIVNVKLDGITLRQTGDYAVVDGLEILKSQQGTNFFLPFIHLTDEGISTGIEFSSQDLKNVSGLSFADKLNDPDWGVHSANTNTNPIQVDIEFDLSFTATRNDLPFGFRARFLKSTQTLVNQNDYQVFTSAPVVGATNNFIGSLSITLQPDERLYFEGIFFGGTTGAIDIDVVFNPGSNVTFTYDNRFKPTFIKAMKPRNAFQQIIGNMTNLTQADAVSALLDANANYVMTSGDGVRSLPGAVIKSNANQFFNSYNVLLNAGIGIQQGKIMMEKKEFFFQSDNPIPLGQVRDPKGSDLTDVLVNTVVIGWPNQDYGSIEAGQNVNGRQEPNTTHTYGSSVVSIVKQLTLVSDYRADAIGSEFERINLDGKTTSDSSSDNDVFLFDIDLAHPQVDPVVGTYYNLFRDHYDVITGLLKPETWFNLRMTPARLMETHRSWLNSLFHGFEGQYLNFLIADKNEDLYTQQGSVIVRENADFQISSSPRILIPRIMEITPEAPQEIVSLLDENPNRCFSYIHPNGNTYKGFNFKVGLAANTLQEQAFQLIYTPDTDLTSLQ